MEKICSSSRKLEKALKSAHPSNFQSIVVFSALRLSDCQSQDGKVALSSRLFSRISELHQAKRDFLIFSMLGGENYFIQRIFLTP